MQKWLAVFGLLFLFSCKPKQMVADSGASKNVAVSKIISGHYANSKDFETLNIKANARYEDDKQTQNVTAEIRIKKDERILVIVRFFGITMAKAMITPDKVSYYEKINGKYFEGNYSLLSKWLGTDLDFQKVQNLFLGLALDDLTKGQYVEALESNMYKLKSKNNGNTEKEFLFEGANFLLKKEILTQKTEGRSLEIDYLTHKDSPKGIMPFDIAIQAMQKDKVSLEIGYNSVSFDEELSFSYDVPDGYEQIFID
ncbi:DUF4292 domain-containing protein [Flavobacterium enshiense]|uniref:Deoxyuridine 5'-triphosphate nucleotidohydrolase n=1 Tax=Flavobacterium enshiense DK69 TaxID=1107311 RepID=A0A0A2MRV1_9FLAO|nr:DUF4292 domain-containing protein [Flavobacterium enshiense]KGO95407.1 hypothetical protein Q767_11435 [Flavobacterium enshiense DK69]